VRVLFTTIRNAGHFLPLVPFVAACRERGHHVAVAAPVDLAEAAAATGATFLPFGHPGDAGLRPIWARLPGLSNDEANRVVIGEIFAGACAGAALPALSEAVVAFRPDVIVRESQEYAAVLAAEEHGVPHVRVSITLQDVERAGTGVAARALEALRAERGLRSDPDGERLASAPALSLFPASLEVPDTTRGSVRRFRAPSTRAAPLPDWWPGRRDPLVYITLGTVAGTMGGSHAIYRTAIQAAGSLPVRALVTTGADLPEDVLGELPPNVHVERFVPQRDVLPEASVVLCHGGSGTVVGTLAAGLPLLVTPLFADQPHNAESVARAGAGLALAGTEASVPNVRRALERLLAEEGFRRAARSIAGEIAALPETSEAAVHLESLASA
jgi:UDP:flavonoid glycosyltransferase YjiC (YdhE family)